MHLLVSSPAAVVGLLAAVYLVGLASSWLASISVGSAAQGLFQWFFCGWLAVVGLATALAFQQNAGGCFLCGAATLSVMMVSAVWDSGYAQRAA